MNEIIIILNDCHLAQLIVHVLHPFYYNVQRSIKVRPFYAPHVYSVHMYLVWSCLPFV